MRCVRLCYKSIIQAVRRFIETGFRIIPVLFFPVRSIRRENREFIFFTVSGIRCFRILRPQLFIRHINRLVGCLCRLLRRGLCGGFRRRGRRHSLESGIKNTRKQILIRTLYRQGILGLFRYSDLVLHLARSTGKQIRLRQNLSRL